MDRERIQRCLGVVRAYWASGHKAKDGAQANGVPERVLASWCAHARLDGLVAPPWGSTKPHGFVAARLLPNAAAQTAQTLHVELNTGATRIELHWPLATGPHR